MKKPKPKILVTGGAGFIGNHLTALLKKKKVDFVSYDLKDSNDILDKVKLDRIFSENQFASVIHLAALTGTIPSELFPEEYFRTNTIGTQNVLDTMKRHKVASIVHFSTSGVLGGNKDKQGLGENTRYDPKTAYGVSKVAGEMMVKKSGLRYAIVRPFTVYGENGRRDMVIYKWITAIQQGKPFTFYGDGSTTRGYTHVTDLVEATWKLVELMLTGHPSCVVHLGGSEKIRLGELLEIFQEHCMENRIEFEYNKAELMEADIEHSFAETNNARILVDFNPKMQFKEKLKEILNKELY